MPGKVSLLAIGGAALIVLGILGMILVNPHDERRELLAKYNKSVDVCYG